MPVEQTDLLTYRGHAISGGGNENLISALALSHHSQR